MGGGGKGGRDGGQAGGCPLTDSGTARVRASVPSAKEEGRGRGGGPKAESTAYQRSGGASREVPPPHLPEPPALRNSGGEGASGLITSAMVTSAM